MLSLRSWIWIPIGIVLTQAPAIGWSATFNVSPGGDSDCSDFNCGLQAALDAAQNNNEGDTILFATGNYDASGGTFFYPSNDVLAAAENFPLTLQGSDPATTILDGGSLQQVMLIDTSNLTADDNADIVVQGLTFQNGNSVGERGGGLFVNTEDADITLNNSRILNNTSDDFGGGVELDSHATGAISASGNLFVGNISTNEESGADFIANDGSITVINNIFFNNQAPGTDAIAGGAFLGFFGGSPANHVITVVNNTVVGNSAASEGGGLWINPDGTLNLYNNIVFGNTAGPSGGADIFIEDIAPSTINYFNNDVGEICFDSTDACDPAAIAGLTQANNINADPLLLDPVNGDFNLGIGSPAVDKGDASAPNLPSVDFAGNPRIVGPAPDMGALEALPDIDVSPATLNFGNVNGPTTLILTISNNGAGVLDVSSVSLGDDVNFSLDPAQGSAPCGLNPTLAGGESCTVGVLFNATGDGTFQTDITILSDDPDEAQFVVPVTGILGGGAVISGGGCALGAAASPSLSSLLLLGGLVPWAYGRRKSRT